MNLPTRMAWRYLFARKSTNAINIITSIAAVGVAIGAAALILLLSVFNGFEDLFLSLFNNLNPDVRITAARGKTFEVDSVLIQDIYRIDGVTAISETLEEVALFNYDGRQGFGRIKGVDFAYPDINGIDTMVREGRYDLDYSQAPILGAVVGNQLAISLGIDVLNQFEPLTVYAWRARPRGSSTLLTGRKPFTTREVMPTGVIRSQETFENQAVLVSLEFARQLLSVPDSTVSALEIGLAPGFDQEATYEAIQAVVGPDFVVRNRYEQENSLLKLMQVEKWVGFAIVSLMMILISFNLVGALWMIVLEKRKDISTLRSLGMTGQNIRGIFLRVGLLLCTLGLLFGFFLAGVLSFLQKQYGLISIPSGLMEAYPISFRWYDFLVVAATVLFIGLLASLLPARRAARITSVSTAT